MHSKIIMNSGKYSTKISRIERVLNIILGINVAIMLSLAAIISGLNYNFNSTHYDSHPYIFTNWSTPSEIALACFFSFYLILNSLFISSIWVQSTTSITVVSSFIVELI